MVRKKAVIIQPKNEKTLEEAFAQFIQAKTVMNLSKSTIGNYRNIFGYFTEFFDQGRRCSEVSQNTIYEYLAWLKEKKPNAASHTVQTYVKGLRAIFYYFMQNEWMEEFKIALPQVDDTIKEVYTDFEVQQLIKKPNLKGVNGLLSAPGCPCGLPPRAGRLLRPSQRCGIGLMGWGHCRSEKHPGHQQSREGNGYDEEIV